MIETINGHTKEAAEDAVAPGALLDKSKALPLAGVRIIDMTRVYSGPYCTFLAAMLGAEVIKIEAPEGESTRTRPGSGSIAFALLNANKQMMTLDLKRQEGIEILRRLLRDADVLVENFRPGVLDRLGLTTERLREINPNLIVARASGYGATGRYAAYPAMDLTIQALSGTMDSTGFPDGPPVKAGPALADFISGTHLFAAIAVALFTRATKGQVISPEIAMLDTVVPSLMSSIAMILGDKEGIPARTGNRHGGMAVAPYNVYPARDGHVAIISISERHWAATMHALGRPDLIDDPRFANQTLRAANMDALDAEIGALTANLDRDELFERLNGSGAVCAPVQTLREVLKDPHLTERGLLLEVDHPQHGPLTVMSSPLRFDETEPADYSPSRGLGEDNDAILQQAGFSADEIAAFRSKGVL